MKFSFTSAGRYYLDCFMASISFHGKVLDIGGKKENKRGLFRPPLEKVQCWHYVNMEAATKPDFLCDAASIPVNEGVYDWVVLTEVIEHLPDPPAVLKECARVLRPGGMIAASMPFLYPVHADPYDFQRWTPTTIRREFEKAGFAVKDISPRGGIIGVILDLINVYFDGPRLSLPVKIFRVVFVTIAPGILWFDRGTKGKNAITGGYTILAVNGHLSKAQDK